MAGNTASKLFRIATVLIAAVAVLVVGGVFLIYKKQQKDMVRLAPAELVTFSDLPNGFTLSATLSMGGKTQEVPVSGNKLVLTEEQRQNFTLPYILKATLRNDKDQYRDLTWSVDSRGVGYYILADGFSPRDKISLSVNDQLVYTIPFDWSGRIQLDSMLIIANDTKNCVNIQDAGTSYGFCHTVTGKRAA